MHKLSNHSYWLDGEEETRSAGGVLAQALKPIALTQPVVVFVRGDLGAGKSTFVRGFLTEMGVRGVMPSPTYSLVEPYHVEDLTLYHMDAYRLSDGAELDYLGLDDLHQPGCITLVEWPDHVVDALPAPHVTVNLSLSAPPGIRMQNPEIPPSDGSTDRSVTEDQQEPLSRVGRALTIHFDDRFEAGFNGRLSTDSWLKLRQVLT